MTAIQQPPHLSAMIVLASPSDPFVEWPTGQPLPMDISWYHFTAVHVLQNMEAVDWKKLYEHLPLITMDEAKLQLPVPKLHHQPADKILGFNL